LIGLEKSGENAIRFKVRVTPRSSKTSITGNPDIGFKMKVKAPPVEGAANEECIRYLAKTFHVSKSSVKLIQGGKSRDKVFEISGITLEEGNSFLKQISK
jgi:hypothetical protein